MKHSKRKKIKQNEICTEIPISIPNEWSDFLNYYEWFIRNLIQEKVSWFIARDHMAGALISTVFNHLWPRARASATISQMTLPMFSESEIIKSKFVEKTKYIKHFSDFFNAHYFNEKNNTDIYKEYLKKTKNGNIKLWDNNLHYTFKGKLKHEQNRLLTRLIAVIDFIAGLTDRYCLEMFDGVYQEFVVT